MEIMAVKYESISCRYLLKFMADLYDFVSYIRSLYMIIKFPTILLHNFISSEAIC